MAIPGVLYSHFDQLEGVRFEYTNSRTYNLGGAAKLHAHSHQILVKVKGKLVMQVQMYM